jgi:uncharacterized membrane protein YidH (DUF202 family)
MNLLQKAFNWARNKFPFFPLCFAFLLIGCASTKKNIPVIIKENTEKDAYINKVESVVSESTSALVSIRDFNLKSSDKEDGNWLALLDSQITRLSGIAKPSVDKVNKFDAMLSNGDIKAINSDLEKARLVDDETERLWGIVEKKDSELSIAKIALEKAEQERKIIANEKTLWMYSLGGFALFSAGVAITAFTQKKIAGGILIVGGFFGMASNWIFGSEWFPWVIGACVSIIALQLIVVASIKAWGFITHPKQSLPQDLK